MWIYPSTPPEFRVLEKEPILIEWAVRRLQALRQELHTGRMRLLQLQLLLLQNAGKRRRYLSGRRQPLLLRNMTEFYRFNDKALTS